MDEGGLRSTLTTRLQGMTVETLREAHRQVESSKILGEVFVTSD